MENKTDCRSETGITVSLIDSLISISRVLAPRLKKIKGRELSKPILEALDDLYQDEDLLYILGTGNYNPHITKNMDLATQMMNDFAKQLKENEKVR